MTLRLSLQVTGLSKKWDCQWAGQSSHEVPNNTGGVVIITQQTIVLRNRSKNLRPPRKSNTCSCIMMFRSLTHFPVLICAGDSLFLIVLWQLILYYYYYYCYHHYHSHTAGSCRDDIEIFFSSVFLLVFFLCRLDILFSLEFYFII